MGTEFERVDEMQSPAVVGRRYLVPCVWHPIRERWRWWPVIGILHADGEHLRFAEKHYHFDYRFFPRKLWQYHASAREDACFSGLPWLSAHEVGYGKVLSDADVRGEVVVLPSKTTYRRMKCLRDFPPSTVGRHRLFEGLHRAYADCGATSSKHGFLCPHKFARLGSLKPDADGIVQCPLHGLRFYAADGRAAPQLPKTILEAIALEAFLEETHELPASIASKREADDLLDQLRSERTR